MLFTVDVYLKKTLYILLKLDLTKEFKTFEVFFFSIYEKYLHDRLMSQKMAPVVLIYLRNI